MLRRLLRRSQEQSRAAKHLASQLQPEALAVPGTHYDTALWVACVLCTFVLCISVQEGLVAQMNDTVVL